MLPIFFLFSISAAQQQAMQRYTVEDGLSQNLVTAFAQDLRGKLWFGTKDGLNMFDGYSFRVFRSALADTNALQSNYISALSADSSGVLWVGTLGGGISRLDESTASFRTWRHRAGDSDGIQSDYVNGIIAGPGTTLIVSTFDGGISLFNSSAGTFTPIARHSSPSIPYRTSRACYLDRDTVLWIGTQSDGLYTYHIPSGSVRHFAAGTGRKGPSHARVKDVHRDSKGTYWIVHESGIDEFDPRTSHFTPHTIVVDGAPAPGVEFREISPGKYFVNAYIRCGEYDPSTRQFHPYEVGVEVTSSFNDRSGMTWLSLGGRGVMKYNPIVERFHTARTSFWEGLYGEAIRAAKRTARIPSGARIESHTIVQDTGGVLWFEHYLQSVIRYEERTGSVTVIPLNDAKNGIRFDHLTRMFIDRTNTVWGTAGFTLLRYRPERGTFEEFPLQQCIADSVRLVNNTEYSALTTLFRDSQGILWLGTSNSGIIRFDESRRRAEIVPADAQNSRSLSSGHILSIHDDPGVPEILWIGTDGGGVNRFDTRTRTVTDRYSTADQLPNDVIYAILKDKKNMLWMSSNNGLFVFDPAERKVTAHYDMRDGLQSNEFNRYEWRKDREGRLYFGGVNGWNSFTPEEIVRRRYEPEVILTDLKIMNSSVVHPRPAAPLLNALALTERVVLQPEQSMISFEFASLDFASPVKNRYRYVLEGWNNRWIDAGTVRTATYTNLDPGTYRFVVQGTNSDGVWSSKSASIEIIVLPPYYKTWWFRSGTALLLAVGTIFTIRSRFLRLRREREQQREFSQRLMEQQEADRERIAAELHDSLGQNLLVVKNRAVQGERMTDDRAAAEHFTQISAVISDSLKEVRSISHNLRPYQLDSLGLTETIRSTVKKLSESTPLEIRSSIDEIDGLLPKEQEINLFRIIQESFNNILKHSGAVRCAVTVKRTGNTMTVTISDDGRGMSGQHPDNTGFGLMGIRERVRMLGGTLALESSAGKGTTITIEVNV